MVLGSRTANKRMRILGATAVSVLMRLPAVGFASPPQVREVVACVWEDSERRMPQGQAYLESHGHRLSYSGSWLGVRLYEALDWK